MEELEKVPKELKGSANLQVEEQYELTSNPRACNVCFCIFNRRWPSWPSLGREAPWSCKLYMPQYRGMPGPRSGSGWVGEQGRYRGLLGQHLKCKCRKYLIEIGKKMKEKKETECNGAYWSAHTVCSWDASGVGGALLPRQCRSVLPEAQVHSSSFRFSSGFWLFLPHLNSPF